MSDYVPIEYPKWVAGVIVNDEAEEHALLDSVTAPEAAPAPEPVAEQPAPPATEPAHEG